MSLTLKLKNKVEKIKNIENIEEQLIQYIIGEYKPRALVLHGSRASGNAVEKSDWDFILFVDEKKEPVRAIILDQNVELSQESPPFDETKAFDRFGLKFRNVKILYDPEHIAEKMISVCQREIEEGLHLTQAEKSARHAFVQGTLSKIERYAHEPINQMEFIGEFAKRARNLWFNVKENRYSLPPYEAIPYIKEKDPEYYQMLSDFAGARGDDLQDAGERIVGYLSKEK